MRFQSLGNWFSGLHGSPATVSGQCAAAATESSDGPLICAGRAHHTWLGILPFTKGLHVETMGADLACEHHAEVNKCRQGGRAEAFKSGGGEVGPGSQLRQLPVTARPLSPGRSLTSNV